MTNIEEIKHQLGEDSIYAVAKYALTKEKKYDNEKIIKTNMFSWIENIETEEEYEEQYNALKELMRIIQESSIVLLVRRIKEDPSRIDLIQQAIQSYQALIHNPDYIEYSNKAKIELPKDFEKEENYKSGMLLKKIRFLELFYEESIKVYENMKKGRNY